MLTFISSGCQQQSELTSEFNCPSITIIKDAKIVTDIRKEYSVNIPKHWKTSFYIDDFQSDIYIADTLKPLTKSFILSISKKEGSLNIDENFEVLLKTAIEKQPLEVTKIKPIIFKEIPSYYAVSKGVKNQFPYHEIQMFIPYLNYFYEFKIEVYGNEAINERFCEAIQLIESCQLK